MKFIYPNCFANRFQDSLFAFSWKIFLKDESRQFNLSKHLISMYDTTHIVGPYTITV